MVIDPDHRAALMLVKEAFEEGALNQAGNASLVPFREMIGKTRAMHQVIQVNVARYPSHYARTNTSNNLIDRIQNECIPCSRRLKALKDLDIKPELYNALNTYNEHGLQSMLDFYKNFKGVTAIERNLCDIYAGLRSQCIPDLQRILAALTFLIQEIRTVDLKALKNGFLQVIAVLAGKMIVGLSTGMDRFTRLITDTLTCIIEDIRAQIGKLNPILTPEGRDQLRTNWQKAWSKNEADKNWLRQNVSYTPIPDASSAQQGLNKAEDWLNDVGQKISSIPKIPFNISGGEILQGVLDLANSRVEANLTGAINELLKLLKANSANLDAMNTYMFQLQSVVGVVSLIRALTNSNYRHNLLDPCGPDRGRQFLQDLQLPNRRIIIQSDPAASLDDPEVVIVPDPTVVDNPIVRDILNQNGISVIEVPAEKDGPTRTQLVVQNEPVTIHFLECIGKSIRG